MKKISLFFVLALSLMLAQSCQKDSIDNTVVDPYADQPAPDLPSEEMFFMPFAGFEDEDPEASPKRFSHWGHAVANVVVWNTVLTVNLAIPTLSFYAAFGEEPEYQGQGVWLWSYEFVDDEDGAAYRAELYGELLVNDEVKWDMYIEQVNGWGRIHWYAGVTANDDSYARWMLKYEPENPTTFLQIDFQRDLATGYESIRYTNVIPDDADNGSYIEYREGAGAAEGFDRAYDVYRADIDNMLEINWDEANKNGRVKDPEKFGDAEWRCWGSDLRDEAC